MRVISPAESRARVAQLRALGYNVKIVNLPGGDRLVMTSKRRFVCNAHHCTWRRDPGGAPAVPFPRKKAKAKRKTKAARRSKG